MTVRNRLEKLEAAARPPVPKHPLTGLAERMRIAQSQLDAGRFRLMGEVRRGSLAERMRRFMAVGTKHTI